MKKKKMNEIARRERLVRVLLCICIYLIVAVIYVFFFKLIASLVHLHFYTVHMHNASFTLYMHTLHEYPRILP